MIYRAVFLLVLAPIGAAAGVICTVLFYWAIIAAIGLAWERRRRKQPVL